MYDLIIVGSGLAGSVLARKFADVGKKVLVLEKRNHIGGNAFEEYRENGIRIHKYGPHIFHTNNKEVFNFLKQYSGWYFYEHKVLGYIDGCLVPIPFNFKSLELLFSEEESSSIKERLLRFFPDKNKVSILDLINHEDSVVKKFGEYVYEKVFANYTAKQWNIPIDKIDASVINRVPIILGYDDRYFQDTYQFMPKDGYTKMFENLLNNDNIKIMTNTDAKTLLNIDIENGQVLFNNKKYEGIVIYTGPIDELLNYKYGPLPYRSLDLVFENYKFNYFQSNSVVNYPNNEKFTRITEFKYLTNQLKNGQTTILKEYPLTYDHTDEKCVPYYAIINEDNMRLYKKYADSISNIKNLFLCGRLAEYKYYNMDSVVERALDLYNNIVRSDEHDER
jgi:UDP-galactopyranose mutase